MRGNSSWRWWRRKGVERVWKQQFYSYSRKDINLILRRILLSCLAENGSRGTRIEEERRKVLLKTDIPYTFKGSRSIEFHDLHVIFNGPQFRILVT